MWKPWLSVLIVLISIVVLLTTATGQLRDDDHGLNRCPDPTNLSAVPLCDVNVKEKGQLFNIITKTVSCPDSGYNKKPLECIIVTDLMPDDNGGYATIIAGGLEQYSVDIRLTSQRGKGIDYHIEVYTGPG